MYLLFKSSKGKIRKFSNVVFIDFQTGSYFGTSQNRIEVQQYGRREKMFVSFSLSKECLLSSTCGLVDIYLSYREKDKSGLVDIY